MVKNVVSLFSAVALISAAQITDTLARPAIFSEAVAWLESESHRFVYTLDLVDPTLADQTVIDLVTDFKKNSACEWVFGEKHRLPNYLASASLPLAGIRAMIEHRETDTSFGVLHDSSD
ncbi:MAG: hypothetical protein U9Q07_08290 [Planctomycetota bacterium]|nr:hypothetical protein [Planctomycetota bacterium]